MTKWDIRFMNVAHDVAEWTSCKRRAVGAVIVKDKQIIATGYNGAPVGIDTCVSRGECMRDSLNIVSGTQHELCYANHAEQNAILQAAKLGISVLGTTIYCTHKPCAICTKMIINAGIDEIVYFNDYKDEFADKLLQESFLKCRQVKPLRDVVYDEYTRRISTPEMIVYDLLHASGVSDEDAGHILDGLNALNYFAAPASCSHHLAKQEGLFIHSFNVAMNLKMYSERMNLKWQKKRSPIIIGLLHDLCKCDQYVKLSTDGYAWNKSADPRHGEKSAEIARMLVPDLTDEENACITYHMGAFVDKSKWQFYSKAVQEYPNVLWTHTADMYASNVDEILEG